MLQEDAISPAIKAEFEEWGTKTTGGVLAGMLYGGAREAASAAVNFSSLLSISPTFLKKVLPGDLICCSVWLGRERSNLDYLFPGRTS